MTRLNLGGPARQALASDPLLVERGHGVRILTGTPEPGEGDLFEDFVERGLDVRRVPGLKRAIAPATDVLVQRRLRKELERFEPDLVHTHASKAGWLGRRAVQRLRRARAIGRVHTFHGHVLEGYFPAAVSRRLVRVERSLAAKTDRLIAVSHATAEDLLRLDVTEERKLVVVQPGIDMGALLTIERPCVEGAAGHARDELRAFLSLAPEDVLVGVVGRLAEVKDPQLALDVYERLADRYPGLHLVFVGDGSERGGLERRIRAAGEASQRRLHVLGARTEMLPVWAALDAVLLTSRSEGLPVCLVEAAAAGLPAVARPVGGVEEVLVHERTGFLGSTADELAFGLARLLDSPEERRAAGGRARLRIQRQHSAERLAERLEALYTLVVGERRSLAGGSA